MAVEDTCRLGCGRSIDRIWATIDQPPSPHEEQCEQCQAARARLNKLREATRALRENDLHDPGLKPRTSVKDNIMALARAEARRSRRIILHTSVEGTTEISEQAISSIIRVAAGEIPGVHARRCRIDLHSTSNDSSGSPDNPLTIGSNINIPRTVEALRQRIGTAIPACVGISAGTINITAEDLYDA